MCSSLLSIVTNALRKQRCEVMLYHIFQNVADSAGSKSVGRWLMASFLPLNTLLGITFGMNGAMIDIIGEKDKKMKIIQNIYGMSETMYWTTWFTFYGLIAVICMCIIYICWLAIVPILTTVNFGISFIILVCAYVQTLLMVAQLSTGWTMGKAQNSYKLILKWKIPSWIKQELINLGLTSLEWLVQVWIA